MFLMYMERCESHGDRALVLQFSSAYNNAQQMFAVVVSEKSSGLETMLQHADTHTKKHSIQSKSPCW